MKNQLFMEASISWIISDETESKIYSTVPYGYFYIHGQIPFMVLFCMNSIAYFHKTMLSEWTFLGHFRRNNYVYPTTVSMILSFGRTYLLGFFKGTVPRDFRLKVFYESVSSKPLIIPLGPFQIFSKIHGDIRSTRCISIDNSGKWKKSSGRKVIIIFLKHLCVVELTYR
jgi:hypothetical protein